MEATRSVTYRSDRDYNQGMTRLSICISSRTLNFHRTFTPILASDRIHEMLLLSSQR